MRGLGFKYYATHPYQFGAVKGNGSRLTFENNTFAWNASIGLSILDPDAVVRGNSFLYNGQIGLHGDHAHRLLVEQNRFAYNNQERFKLTSAAGGMKITTGRDMIWRDNLSEGNLGGGMWCDLSCYNVTIVRNTVRNNAQNGILYEISAKAIIASNLIHGNGRYGLSLNESEDLDIYNNTLSKNRCDISVWEGYRYSTADPAITHNVRDVVIRNNIMSNAISTDGLLKVRSQDEHKNVSEMGVTTNHNGYYRTSLTPETLVEWVRYNKLVRYRSLTEFVTGSGQDRNGVAIDNVAVNPFFVDETKGDYRLKAGSPALLAGTPLPAAIASALGVPAGVQVDLGALGMTPLTASTPADLVVDDSILVPEGIDVPITEPTSDLPVEDNILLTDEIDVPETEDTATSPDGIEVPETEVTPASPAADMSFRALLPLVAR